MPLRNSDLAACSALRRRLDSSCSWAFLALSSSSLPVYWLFERRPTCSRSSSLAMRLKSAFSLFGVISLLSSFVRTPAAS